MLEDTEVVYDLGNNVNVLSNNATIFKRWLLILVKIIKIRSVYTVEYTLSQLFVKELNNYDSSVIL